MRASLSFSLSWCSLATGSNDAQDRPQPEERASAPGEGEGDERPPHRARVQLVVESGKPGVSLEAPAAPASFFETTSGFPKSGIPRKGGLPARTLPRSPRGSSLLGWLASLGELSPARALPPHNQIDSGPSLQSLEQNEPQPIFHRIALPDATGSEERENRTVRTPCNTEKERSSAQAVRVKRYSPAHHITLISSACTGLYIS